jgi:hypothetical protein
VQTHAECGADHSSLGLPPNPKCEPGRHGRTSQHSETQHRPAHAARRARGTSCEELRDQGSRRAEVRGSGTLRARTTRDSFDKIR